MRVAIITRDYPPAIGGIATHVEGLVKALGRKGVEVDLYVGRNDVKTLLLPFDIPLKEYDVVHAQSAPYGAFVFGVPLVVTVHSPVMEELPHYRSTLKLASIPAIALERVAVSRASVVLAVSDQSRSLLLRMYRPKPEKVEVIGNGVDFQKFCSGRTPKGPDDVRRMLVVSRLEPRKNVREAIEALAELPRGACHLDIAGDGSEKSALVELVRSLGLDEFVHFLGRVDGETLPSLYGRAAIFLTTSRSEGYGLSLLEAMSAGCACVASDLPTHRALVKNATSGVIYRTKADLVSSLVDLLSSKDKVERLSRAAQEAASGQTWEKVAEMVSTAYERVARDSGH